MSHLLAQVGLLVEAELARLALRRVQRDDVIAGLKGRHAGTDGLDDSAAFVSENAREQAFRIDARKSVRIGVALRLIKRK